MGSDTQLHPSDADLTASTFAIIEKQQAGHGYQGIRTRVMYGDNTALWPVHRLTLPRENKTYKQSAGKCARGMRAHLSCCRYRTGRFINKADEREFTDISNICVAYARENRSAALVNRAFWNYWRKQPLEKAGSDNFDYLTRLRIDCSSSVALLLPGPYMSGFLRRA